jgi:hypothetical protein
VKPNIYNIDRETLREVLLYDPSTGIFKWKPESGNRKIGHIAGTINPKDGYRRIAFGTTPIMAHRLAWMYIYGKFPDKFIDHINGNRDDNRITNLRESSQRQNQQNLNVHRAGKLVGACYYKATKKWVARIGVGYKENKKTIYLGSYDTEKEAHKAYVKACGI